MSTVKRSPFLIVRMFSSCILHPFALRLVQVRKINCHNNPVLLLHSIISIRLLLSSLNPVYHELLRDRIWFYDDVGYLDWSVGNLEFLPRFAFVPGE